MSPKFSKQKKLKLKRQEPILLTFDCYIKSVTAFEKCKSSETSKYCVHQSDLTGRTQNCPGDDVHKYLSTVRALYPGRGGAQEG